MSKDSSNLPTKESKEALSRSLISWNPLSAIAFAIIVYFAAQYVGVQLVVLYPVMKHWSASMTNDWFSSSIIAQFAYVLLAEGLTVMLLWLFLKRHKVTFRILGLITPKLEDIAYALSGLVLYFPAYIAIVTVLSSLVPKLNVSQQQQIGFQNAVSGSQLVLVFLSLVLLPPIVEELMFRGFLYTSLRKKLPIIWAAILTSTIFAVPHLLEGANGGLLWIAGIDTFILSLVLVWLREKTGRLYASMGLHALKNFIAFASLFLLHAH